MKFNQTNTYHIPVLLNECLEGLNINPVGTYIDLTFGGGGHSKAILNKLSDKGQLFAFDKDKDAIENAIDDERFCLINDDFSNMTKQLRLYRITQVDGILADLGISSHQIDTTDRGFSFRNNSALDLRMNTSSTITAADIINSYSEEELSKVFYMYAEIPQARKVASFICKKRLEKPIETTFDLTEILSHFVRPNLQQKFFAKIFQAIRIEVNNELNSLTCMLNQLKDIIKPTGRVAIISYHSLEDKKVKNLIKTGNPDGIIEKDFFGNINTPFLQINKKPIIPKEEEIQMNPRSRSAKLRIAERK